MIHEAASEGQEATVNLLEAHWQVRENKPDEEIPRLFFLLSSAKVDPSSKWLRSHNFPLKHR
jgi:hypothetical protein